nr:hypothetical protein Iba_chr10cCG9880 [Ipomoea batatas]
MRSPPPITLFMARRRGDKKRKTAKATARDLPSTRDQGLPPMEFSNVVAAPDSAVIAVVVPYSVVVTRTTAKVPWVDSGLLRGRWKQRGWKGGGKRFLESATAVNNGEGASPPTSTDVIRHRRVLCLVVAAGRERPPPPCLFLLRRTTAQLLSTPSSSMYSAPMPQAETDFALRHSSPTAAVASSRRRTCRLCKTEEAHRREGGDDEAAARIHGAATTVACYHHWPIGRGWRRRDVRQSAPPALNVAALFCRC